MPENPETHVQESGVYGEALQARATALVSRSLQKATLAVTELRYDSPQHVFTPPVREDAFVVALFLRDFPVYEYWENHRAAPVSALKAGHITIYDVKRKPVFHLVALGTGIAPCPRSRVGSRRGPSFE